MYKHEMLYSRISLDDLLEKIVNWANKDSKEIVSVKYEEASHYMHDRVSPEFQYYAYIIWR